MPTSSPDFGVWRRTSPFAIVFFLGATVKNIARSYIQLAASFGAIAYLTRFRSMSGESWLPLVIPAAVVAIGAAALLRYWFFRFKLQEDRVLILQGVLKRTALDLPFDRVQGINVERSLVDRVLGLVTVRLDTAGSIVAEGRLPAVSTELADWLRTRVDRGRRGRRAAAGEDQPEPPAADAGAVAGHARGSTDSTLTPAPDQILLRLSGRDMLRIALADRKALVFAGALAALGQAAEPFQDVVAGVFESLQRVVVDLGPLVRTSVMAALALTVLVTLLVAVVTAAFLRHHGFTLWRRGTALRSRGGLLTQKEVVVETAKIQQLTLSRNLVLHWFRRYRFGALPAGAIQMPGSEGPANLEFADNLAVPLLDASAAESLRRQIFGNEAAGLTLLPASPAFKRVSPYYIRAFALRAGVLPLLVATVFFSIPGAPVAVTSLPFALGSVAWLALSVLIGLQSWRRRGYLHDDEGLASRRGFIGSRVDAFLFRKVQGVTVRQSPLERRKRLASLEVHLSSGAVAIPCIAQEAATSLRDYILYKVESSRLRWH